MTVIADFNGRPNDGQNTPKIHIDISLKIFSRAEFSLVSRTHTAVYRSNIDFQIKH